MTAGRDRAELSTLIARTQGGYELDVTKLLCLANDADIELAAEALVEGLPVAAGFANFYVIYTRADASTVGQMNIWKGRPPDQTGSIGTTTLRVPTLFDFNKLPPHLTEKRVLDVMEAFLNRGPIGFRGPAATDLPRHMTGQDGDVAHRADDRPGLSLSEQQARRADDRAGARALSLHHVGESQSPSHRRRGARALEARAAHLRLPSHRQHAAHPPRIRRRGAQELSGLRGDVDDGDFVPPAGRGERTPRAAAGAVRLDAPSPTCGRC